MIKVKKVKLNQMRKKDQTKCCPLLNSLKYRIKEMLNKIFKYFFVLIVILIIQKIFKNKYKSAIKLCYFLNKINNLRLDLL